MTYDKYWYWYNIADFAFVDLSLLLMTGGSLMGVAAAGEMERGEEAGLRAAPAQLAWPSRPSHARLVMLA